MTNKHTLVERLRYHGEDHGNGMLLHAVLFAEAANRITALEAEKVPLVSENARLREAIARLANSINIVGSPYHRAQQALDDLVSEVKQTARATLATLTKAHQSDEGE